jgi:beta-glucuronidase
MPVPSSFNDITQDPKIRDYVGWFWYKKDFLVHDNFYNSDLNDLLIHFGSVNYHCEVFVNDVHIGHHSSGHLPFELKIPHLKINFNSKINTIKVLANNILTLNTTIPQANTYSPQNSTNIVYPDGFKITNTYFDFFNYAGKLNYYFFKLFYQPIFF